MDHVAAHWQELDRLLPTEVAPPPDDADRIDVDGGHGWALTTHADPELLSSVWTPDTQHTLTPRVTSPDALDRLLSAWRRDLGQEPGSLAKVTWPARDTAMSSVLFDHGFHPSSALAIRPSGREATADPPTGVRVVRPDDTEDVTRLWMEVVDWDVQFGSLFHRPSTEELVAEAAAEVCSTESPLSLVAEVEGELVSAVLIQHASQAQWVQPMTSASPAAYLSVGGTAAEHRSSGVGTQLARAAAGHVDQAGYPVTLLNYATTNPLSAPFWHRLGYRPLWLTWRRFPTAS